jgi:hypothetical protein
MRQTAFLSVAASLDLDSVGLRPITTITMAIVIGTVTIASRPNPVVATDRESTKLQRQGAPSDFI